MGGRVVGAFAVASLAALTGCSPNSDGANVADSAGTSTVTSPPATTGIREPTFGLDAEVDGYLIEVSEVTNVGGQGIDIDVTRAGAPVTSVQGDAAHVFAIGPGMSFFQHDVSPADQVMPWLRSWQNINDTGTSRVMVMFDDRDGPVVLGTDVVVREESDFGGAMIVGIDGSYRIQSGVAVERDGWDFTLAVPWGGGSAAGDAAWLTLVRRSDLALTFDVAELVGDRTFRFAPELPGGGEYLAVLEFLPYGYRPSLDADEQRLANSTGSSDFMFWILVDEHGMLATRPEDDLVTAVEAFMSAVGAGEADDAWDLVSARCRDFLGRIEFETTVGLGAGADIVPRRVIGINVAIEGDRATASYQTAHGEYVPGEQPYSPTTFGESWINEEGWHWNGC